MALATIGGPLLGGLITDAFGLARQLLHRRSVRDRRDRALQSTLHLPRSTRHEGRRSTTSASSCSPSASRLLLIWVSMGGSQFDWDSIHELSSLIGIAAVAARRFVIVEFFVKEPIVPMSLFKNRTFTLVGHRAHRDRRLDVRDLACSSRSTSSSPVARHPTESGLMTIPMVVGQMGASIIIGQLDQPVRQVEGLDGHRLGARARRRDPHVDAALRHPVPLGRRLHVRPRRRPRHGHAEPHPRRAERHPAAAARRGHRRT